MIANKRCFLSSIICILFLSLYGCGGGGGSSPQRYQAEEVAAPATLTATAGNGEVALSWPAVSNASGYTVYYSTSGSVDKSASKVSTLGTSTIITGLANDTTYYFAVSSVNAYYESSLSSVASANPTNANFGQVDLEGTWNFKILVSGADPGWMQANVSISNGNATFNSFLDSSGNTSPPADLFAALSILPDGAVVQAGSAADFRGELSNNGFRDILVGTATWRNTCRLAAIGEKQVSTVTFSDGDLHGLGGNSGPRFYAYNQISSGAVQEWEFGVCKVGQGAPYYPVEYMAFASSDRSTSTFPYTTTFLDPVLTSFKASKFSIDAAGTVTESDDPALSVNAVNPADRPGVYFQGTMSADKTVMAGAFTDPRFGTADDTDSRKYILRIYQIINPNTDDYPNDQTTPLTYDLSNPFNLQEYLVGPTALTAYGTMQMSSSSGVLDYLTYQDGNSNVLPSDFFFAFTQIPSANKAISASLGGIITDPGNATYPADPSLYGKVSRYSYMTVWTRTGQNGQKSLSIGMQKP